MNFRYCRSIMEWEGDSADVGSNAAITLVVLWYEITATPTNHITVGITGIDGIHFLAWGPVKSAAATWCLRALKTAKVLGGGGGSFKSIAIAGLTHGIFLHVGMYVGQILMWKNRGKNCTDTYFLFLQYEWTRSFCKNHIQKTCMMYG